MSDLGYCPTCTAPGVKRFTLLGLTRCLNGHRHSSNDFNPPALKRAHENSIEQHFVAAVRASGGETRKVKWLGHDGAPDRLAGWPDLGRHALVELKRPKGIAEIHQRREHDKLRAMGFRVDILDTKEAVDQWVKEMVS